MTWQFIAGAAGALVYYVTRYQPRNPGTLYTAFHLGFWEYLRYEWLALAKGIIGFVLLWAAWVYAADVIIALAAKLVPLLEGLTLPPMSVPLALILGGLGKPFYDRVPRLWDYVTKRAA